MAKRGVLIVFEGIDGSGKSTHVDLLSKELQEKGYNVLTTFEPTRGRIGNLIQRYSSQKNMRFSPVTETLLFAADRFEHVKGIIEPAISRGRIVISDRYAHSSLAYQGASGVDIGWIRKVNRFAPMPDLGILFDIQPEYSLMRVKRKRTVFEVTDYLRRVRNNYLEFVEDGELIRLNADRSKAKIQAEVSLIVTKFMEMYSSSKKFLIS